MWDRSVRNEEVRNTYKILISKPAVKISMRVYSDNLYGKTMLKLDTEKGNDDNSVEVMLVLSTVEHNYLVVDVCC